MRSSRGFLLPAAALALLVALLPAVQAQNGTNYHILTNGLDVTYLGVGAGGNQTKADGLGTWIAGEDLRGSHKLGSDFGYHFRTFRENVAVLHAPAGGGQTAIKFRGLYFFELDGLNGNDQAIFLNPSCPTSGPSFPLGNSAGFIPYGAFASVSFLVAGLPAGTGPAPSSAALLPNNGLLASITPGTATLAFSSKDVTLPIPSVGFTWSVQFNVFGSSITLQDDIDGLWHYVLNSDDDNQYWAFSDDELNIWQSNSVASDGGLTGALQFPANADYDLLLAGLEPETVATLAPVGLHLSGAYYTQTENVQNEYGVTLNPNGGFDVGRGSAALSISGMAGVPNPVTGLGNQNPASNPGKIPTLGFFTWNNGGDGDGSVRLTWVSVDILGARSGNPALDPGITQQGGTIRVPVVSAGYLQELTRSQFSVYGHVTMVGYGDPGGYPGGSFGVSGIAGASQQLPASSLPVACQGLKLNLTYGTSGRSGRLGSPGPLTWDPMIADISGTREIAIFD